MIEIRALSFTEQEKYDEFVEAMKSKEYSEDKQLRESAKYICTTIYDMDLNSLENTMMKCLYVFAKTMEACQNLNEEELKNFARFGSGELKAE